MPPGRPSPGAPRAVREPAGRFHRKHVRRAAGAQPELVVAGQREAASRRSLGGARVSFRAGTANRPNVRVGSNCDLRHRLALRLECDGEPTFTPERRLGSGTPQYQMPRQTASPGSPGLTAPRPPPQASGLFQQRFLGRRVQQCKPRTRRNHGQRPCLQIQSR